MAGTKSRMAKIITKKGDTILIDEVDFKTLGHLTWYVNNVGYAANDVGKRKGIRTLLHRAILGNPKYNIDHKNGNKLDNRRENLRPCNQSQNTANAGIRKNNKAGYKGVTYDERNPNMKWIANLTKNYKHIYIGAFRTKEEAAVAYNSRAIKEFGEFANLNTI